MPVSYPFCCAASLLVELNFSKGDKRKCMMFSYILCIELVYLVSVSYKRTEKETIALLVQASNLTHFRFSDSNH